MQSYLAKLPKCGCGAPATIHERNRLICAPCSLIACEGEIKKWRAEQEALAAEERRLEQQRQKAAEREQRKFEQEEREREAERSRQVILAKAEEERNREAELSPDSRATIDLNRELVEKYRARRIARELAAQGYEVAEAA